VTATAPEPAREPEDTMNHTMSHTMNHTLELAKAAELIARRSYPTQLDLYANDALAARELGLWL
jgi:hypothetical protein